MEFGYKIQRKYVCEVGILVGDLCKSLFGNQVGYLRSIKKKDYIKRNRAEKRGGAKERNVNYKGLILQIKYCNCKLFFPH